MHSPGVCVAGNSNIAPHEYLVLEHRVLQHSRYLIPGASFVSMAQTMPRSSWGEVSPSGLSIRNPFIGCLNPLVMDDGPNPSNLTKSFPYHKFNALPGKAMISYRHSVSKDQGCCTHYFQIWLVSLF